MITNIEWIADEIIEMLTKGKHVSYGEDISQLEHALQCAKLATDPHSDEEVILAALLHDIGHVCAPEAERMGDLGAVDHEALGAEYLRQHGFSERVAELVQSHVQAKRYLTFKNPHYHAQLSEASKRTLIHQGGPMKAEECAAFEMDPLFKEKLRLRSWDEQGKLVNVTIPPLSTYRPLLIRHLEHP